MLAPVGSLLLDNLLFGLAFLGGHPFPDLFFLLIFLVGSTFHVLFLLVVSSPGVFGGISSVLSVVGCFPKFVFNANLFIYFK